MTRPTPTLSRCKDFLCLFASHSLSLPLRLPLCLSLPLSPCLSASPAPPHYVTTSTLPPILCPSFSLFLPHSHHCLILFPPISPSHKSLSNTKRIMPSPTTTSNFPLLPLDPTIALFFHKCNGRVPGTFQPEDFQPGFFTHGGLS